MALLALASFAKAASPIASLPDQNAEAEFNLLCTVTDAGLSKDCRFYVGVADATERLKAGAVLAGRDGEGHGFTPGRSMQGPRGLRRHDALWGFSDIRRAGNHRSGVARVAV